MLKKIILLNILYVSLIIIESCNDCGSYKNTGNYFRITDVSSLFSEVSLDSDIIKIEAENLIFSFEYQVEFYDLEEAYMPFFTNKLLACDPVSPGELGSEQTLNNFTITCLTGFNEFQAGDTVTQLFDINGIGYDEFSSEVLNHKIMTPYNQLKFTSPSTVQSDTLQIKLNIDIDDNLHFELISDSVIVN